MNTRERIHQLELIYEVCCAEMTKLRTSITTFLEESSIIYKFICGQLEIKKEEDMVALIAYDEYLTKLSHLTDMTRKFNLHLYFQELQQKKEIQNVCNQVNALNFHEQEELILPKSEPQSPKPLFLYEKASLDDININDEIEAVIVNVERVEDSYNFSICRLHDPLVATLLNIRKPLTEPHGRLEEIPSPNEIFGLKSEDILFRTVRENTNEIKDTYLAYLLEFGEITEITKESEMYKLPDILKNVPAQAFQCVLISVDGDTECGLRESLLKYENRKAHFTVVWKDESILYMNLVEKIPAEKPSKDEQPTVEKPILEEKIEEVKTEKSLPNSETNPFKCAYPDAEAVAESNGLTAAEVEELYEEPIQTTNAMKAVMGYIPKDEAKICKFYNPITKGCFKGTNCKMLHTTLLKEGWTKDQEAVLIDTCVPMVYPADGTILRVIPTHIVDVCTFYAQLEFSERNENPLFWSSRDIPEKTKLKSPPFPFDMVLAKFSDGNWYRARIMDCFEDKTYRVFYVDYGNEDIVSLVNLASWNKGLSSYSFQAYRCRIAGIANATKDKIDEDNAIKIIGGLILDQFVSVRVLHSIDEEMLVEFVDKNCAKLPDMLVWQQYAQQVDKIL